MPATPSCAQADSSAAACTRPRGGGGACAPRTRRVRVACACASLGCVSWRSASGSPFASPPSSTLRERVTATHDPRDPGPCPTPPACGGSDARAGEAPGGGDTAPRSGWEGRWHRPEPASVGDEDEAREGLQPAHPRRTRRPPGPGARVPGELSPRTGGRRLALRGAGSQESTGEMTGEGEGSSLSN